MFDVSNRLLAREVASSFTLVRLRRGSGNPNIPWFVGVLRKVLYVGVNLWILMSKWPPQCLMDSNLYHLFKRRCRKVVVKEFPRTNFSNVWINVEVVGSSRVNRVNG